MRFPLFKLFFVLMLITDIAYLSTTKKFWGWMAVVTMTGAALVAILEKDRKKI